MYVVTSGEWRVRFYGSGYAFDSRVHGVGWVMADDIVPLHVSRRLLRKAYRMMERVK